FEIRLEAPCLCVSFSVLAQRPSSSGTESEQLSGLVPDLFIPLHSLGKGVRRTLRALKILGAAEYVAPLVEADPNVLGPVLEPARYDQPGRFRCRLANGCHQRIF